MTACPSEHKHALTVTKSRLREGLVLRHDIVVHSLVLHSCRFIYDVAITSTHKHSQNILFNTAR